MGHLVRQKILSLARSVFISHWGEHMHSPVSSPPHGLTLREKKRAGLVSFSAAVVSLKRRCAAHHLSHGVSTGSSAANFSPWILPPYKNDILVPPTCEWTSLIQHRSDSTKKHHLFKRCHLTLGLFPSLTTTPHWAPSIGCDVTNNFCCIMALLRFQGGKLFHCGVAL